MEVLRALCVVGTPDTAGESRLWRAVRLAQQRLGSSATGARAGECLPISREVSRTHKCAKDTLATGRLDAE
jgi:hypothetical protein